MQKFDEENARSVEFELADYFAGVIQRCKDGSDEQLNAVKSFDTIARLYYEDCKISNQVYKDEMNLELEKEKAERDFFIREREQASKEKGNEAANKWYNSRLTSTVLACMTTVAINVSAIAINASDSPLVQSIERWMKKDILHLTV